MIATILPGSTNFHAVGYNEHKVSKGVARLIEIQNFGSLGIFHKPTQSELVGYLQKYSSQNSRIRKPQFHVAISCKGHEMSEDELLDFAHQYLKDMGYGESGQPLLVYSHYDTENTHLHIITSRVAHLMEERFSTAMSADVPRRSLTVFLGMTGKRKRKMILMQPNSIHSLPLPSLRQSWFPWDMKSIRKMGMYSSGMVERFRRKCLFLK